jgi:gas vesicle protein
MRDPEAPPYIVVDRNSSPGIGAFLLGAALGAGLALLFAPRSGAETQQEIRERAAKLKKAAEARIREAQAQVEETLDEVRDELRDRIETVKDAVEAGKASAREARDELEERIERSKAAYRAGVSAAKDAARSGANHEEGAAS